jgi:ATP-dependent helicase HrpA
LFGKSPRWLVASEIVETTKIYARGVARIEPEWLESLAPHLIRRSYSDPHWEQRAGRVIALEQVTLYGLPIVTQRRVDYGPLDPVLAREIFIRSALVQGDYASQAPFFRHNRALIEEIEGLEHKSRRRDLLADEPTVYTFYDERLPETVYDHRSLETWRREAEQKTPKLLYLDRETLLRDTAATVSAARFPDHLRVEGTDLPLRYHFEPGAPDDGVTLEVPITLLPCLEEWRYDYLVPGLLAEKLTFLLRSLPKPLRVNFIPVPEYVRAACETFAESQARESPLPEALARFLQRLTGVEVPPAAFHVDDLPPHLRMGYRIFGDDGTLLAAGRDLTSLRVTLGTQAEVAFRRLAQCPYERESVTTWDFGPLPTQVELPGTGLNACPALTEEENGRIALRLFATSTAAAAAHRAGLRRLFAVHSVSQMRALERHLPISREATLAYTRQGGVTTLKHEILDAALDAVFLTAGTDIRDAVAFQTRLAAGRAQLQTTAEELAHLAATILADAHSLARELRKDPPAHRAAYEDMRSQLDALVYPGFIATTPLPRLRHYPRYLKAMVLRLEKMHNHPARDYERLAEIAPWWARFQERATADRARGVCNPQLEELRWMLEEWRVSLFAQELKAAIPISAKRVEKQWAALAS